MTTETKQDFREWMADWQSDSATSQHPTAAERIRRHVQRREQLLVWWLVGEAVIGVVFFAFLLHRARTHPDPIEKLTMGLLALAVVAISLFEGYNWRGGLRASAETTSTYIALALDRSRRLRRSLRAGWPLLASEAFVFTPWTWYHVYGNGTAPTTERAVFAWGLLIAMTAVGALALTLAQRWAEREATDLENLRSAMLGGDAESWSPAKPS